MRKVILFIQVRMFQPPDVPFQNLLPMATELVWILHSQFTPFIPGQCYQLLWNFTLYSKIVNGRGSIVKKVGRIYFWLEDSSCQLQWRAGLIACVKTLIGYSFFCDVWQYWLPRWNNPLPYNFPATLLRELLYESFY